MRAKRKMLKAIVQNKNRIPDSFQYATGGLKSVLSRDNESTAILESQQVGLIATLIGSGKDVLSVTYQNGTILGRTSVAPAEDDGLESFLKKELAEVPDQRSLSSPSHGEISDADGGLS